MMLLRRLQPGCRTAGLFWHIHCNCEWAKDLFNHCGVTADRMKTNDVLILGSNRGDGLAQVLYRTGFNPLERETMEEALHAILSLKFAALFIDKDNAKVDALEFILNVRDVDRHTPIVVVGDPEEKHYELVLSVQKNVIRLDSFSDENTVRKLKRDLENIFI